SKLQNKNSIRGIGDDAAVIDAGDHCKIVSKDLLLEGIHFNMMYMPLKHLGYKTAIVNFSDIYAMNGIPTQLLVGLGLSSRYTVEAIEEIYSGIHLACQQYGVDFVGGDTTSSLSGLILSATVIGEAKIEDIVYRNTAKKNDLICISGDLGAAYIGLLLLEREKEVFKANPSMQPELEQADYVLERQLKPEARADIIAFFKEKNIKPTAMIDVSDGLASEILHIANQSALGCRIMEDAIPINYQTIMKAEEFKLEPTTCALNGGEDYELLFTVDQKYYDTVKQNSQIAIIGYMTDESEGCNLMTRSDALMEIKAQGWDSLKE
nr:thiamine-phosphate kinase [Bacteroidales bacterium]